jgi:hypothetical protein
MAPEEKKESNGNNENKAPLNHNDKGEIKPEEGLEKDFFVSNYKPKEEISERDIFAGNEDFYKLLSDSIEVPHGEFVSRNPQIAGKQSKSFVWIKRFLITAIITITAVMGYVILKNNPGLLHGPVSSTASQVTIPAQQEIEPVIPQQPEK